MLDYEKGRFMLNNPLHRTVSGFSLIELMIAIALLGIVLAMGFPTYTAWTQNVRIRNTAESMQNGLQIARAEAVRRNALVQFVLGANSDWTVGCVNVVPDNDGDGEDDCPALIQSRPTAEGATADIIVTPTPGGSTTVVFNALGAVENAPVPFSQLDVDVSSSVLAPSESRELRLTLGIGGDVRLCDPQLPATDVRAC